MQVAAPRPGRQREWRLVRNCRAGAGMTPRTLSLSETGGVYRMGRVDPGRRLGNHNLQFTFDSTFVSRDQCSVHCRNGVWHIRDHGSSNGTFLNGDRIEEERELRDNDRIGLGVDSMAAPTLHPPFDYYHVYTFRQIDAGKVEVEVMPLPAQVTPKVDVPEVITLGDSDDDDDNEPSAGGSTTLTTGSHNEPKEEPETPSREVAERLKKDRGEEKGNEEAAALQEKEQSDLRRKVAEENKPPVEEEGEGDSALIAELAPAMTIWEANMQRQVAESEQNRLAQAARKADEEKSRLAQVAARKRAEDKRMAKEAERKRQEAETKKRLKAEADARKKKEEERREAAEKQREAEKEKERQRQLELENERRRKAEEAERKKEEELRSANEKAARVAAAKEKREAEEEKERRLELEIERRRKAEEAERKKEEELRSANEKAARVAAAKEKREAEEEKERQLELENERRQKAIAEKQKKEEELRLANAALVAAAEKKREAEEEAERRHQLELKKEEMRRKKEERIEKERADKKTVKRQQRLQRKEEYKIAFEQREELRRNSTSSASTSSSAEVIEVMEVDSPPPPVEPEIIELTRRNQAKMTETLVRRKSNEKKKGATPSSKKPYKRLRILSSSSDESKEGEDFDFVSHDSNPYIPTQESSVGRNEGRSVIATNEKVRLNDYEIRLFRVLSVKNGKASFSIPEEQWAQLNAESRERVVVQFRRSCTENGLPTMTPKPKKRKTPDDVSGRVESVTKKTREEAPPQALPTPVSASATPISAPSTPISASSTPTLAPSTPISAPSTLAHATPLPPAIEVTPILSVDRNPSLPEPIPKASTSATAYRGTSIGASAQGQSSVSDMASMPPPPQPREQSAVNAVGPQRFMGQRPQNFQTKDLNKVIHTVHSRMEKPMPKIKLLSTAAALPKRKRQHQQQQRTEQPVRQNSMEEGTSPPGPDRKAKLRELALTNKPDPSFRIPCKAPPGTASVKTKTTSVSRSDLLIGSIAAVPTPKAVEKPKATVAPLPPGNAEPREPNVVNEIKRQMDNNRLSQVVEKPLVVERRPNMDAPRHSKDPIGHQVRGGGTAMPSTSSSLPHCHVAATQSSMPNGPPEASTGNGGQKNGSGAASSSTVNSRAIVPMSRKPEPSTSTSTSSANTSVVRLPEDQVYKDTLMWVPKWIEEQESNTKYPPPVNHGQPVLTNLPIYKDYESYKNTFYPLMLLELWASILQESTSKDNARQKSRMGMDSIEISVGIEAFEATDACPLLIPSQENTHQRRQKTQTGANRSEGAKFYHSFRLVALVERHGELNRDRDFGTITFDFRRSNGEIQPLTFFAFFQEPHYEEITPMSVIPKGLEKELRSKKFKVTFQTVTHIKYDVKRLIRENCGKMKKICYISSKIRDFRSLSQLPDSTLFQHILSPPDCTPEQAPNNEAVSRSELVANTFEMLNPVQRSVVHQISRRVVKGYGPDMMLLHGPPGTGKTRTIVGLILQLTQDYRCNNLGKQLKILVCTPSNTALDEIIRRLMQEDDGLKIVRIGSGSVSEDTKQYLLEEVAKPYLSKAGQIDSINQSIQNVDRRIENAKAEIQELKVDEKNNGTMISSYEANIIEWQKDRKSYICDLNSVGPLAQLIFENVTLNDLPIHRDTMAAFIEPWLLLKQELGFNVLNHPPSRAPFDMFPEHENVDDINLQPVLASRSVAEIPLRKSPRIALAFTLNQTCRYVLQRLQYETISLNLVKQLLKGYSSLDDPCQALAELVNSAELQRYSSQAVDNTSAGKLPTAFLRALQPVETGSDGNCFFRAVSHCIFGHQMYYELLRICVLLDVLENDASYIWFTTTASTEDDYDSLIESVGTLGEFTGDAAIYATSKILRRPIHVYTEFPDPPLHDAEFMQYMTYPGNRKHRRTLFDDAYTFEEPRSDRKGMDQAKRRVILNSQVVFSTLNSCSSGQLRRQSKTSPSGRQEEIVKESPLFTCCIVDESTQTTEPEALAPLMLGCDKLILVGDPKQLPATVLSIEAESKKFRQSLFTRIFNHYEDSCGGEGSPNPVMMLTTQYRMHREILKWPNEWFYGKRLVTHSSVDSRPPLKIRPYIFLNVASKESNAQRGQISNDDEVKFLQMILRVLNGFFQTQPLHRGLSIGIITPYNEQRKKVCQVVNEIKKENFHFGNSIEVDTVDSFQGREKDIILLSCVRTQDLGFVKTPERLNVALTRAKQSLIIVGNAVCLNSNVMWKNLMDDATERGHYTSVNSTHVLRGEGFLTDYIRNILTLP